jgi:hypothetical protein
MPVSVVVDDCIEREQVYILDPGNSRIKCLTLDGKLIGHLGKKIYKNELDYHIIPFSFKQLILFLNQQVPVLHIVHLHQDFIYLIGKVN